MQRQVAAYPYALRADAHHAGLDADNPRQRMRLRFDSSGVQASTPDGSILKLRTLDIAGTSPAAAILQVAAGAADRLSRHAGEVTEWFDNNARGLEQSWRVDRVPAPQRAMVIRLAASGDLRPVLRGGEVRFEDHGGRAVMRYGGARAWDGAGRALPVVLRVRGTEISVEVATERASFPVTVDPVLSTVQDAELSAADGVNGNLFGSVVAADGDTVVVGAGAANGNAGIAYIFSRNQGGANTWGLVKEIAGAAASHFAGAIAVSGDTVAIGADASNGAAGEVHVLSRNQGGADAWGEVKVITPSDTAANQEFGAAVALNGATLIVGAPGGGEALGGAAYVFEQYAGGAGQWGELTKINALDGAASDEFGFSAALDGDLLVVGAPGKNAGQGAAYIYSRDQGGSGAWGLTRELNAYGAAGDHFGSGVAVSGDTAAISALHAAASTAYDGIYIFLRNAGGAGAWGESTAVSTSVLGADVSAVALHKDALVVGLSGLANAAGAAALLARDQGGSGTWGVVTALKAADGVAGDAFGTAVALAGDTLVVGAAGRSNAQGSAYVLSIAAQAYGQIAEPAVPGAAPNNLIARSVAIDGDTLVVSAEGQNTDQGAAYVFYRDQGGANQWGMVAQLTAADGKAQDSFGHALAINGDTILVGAFYKSFGAGSLQQGAAYLYSRNAGGADAWGQVAELSTMVNGQEFGWAVALAHDTAVIGVGGGTGGTNNNKGLAYVYERDQGGVNGWGLIKTLQGPAFLTSPNPDSFGRAVAASGDTLIVGAQISPNASGSYNGGAYVYQRDAGGAGQWGLAATLTAADAFTNDGFGDEVALDGDTALIGGSSSFAYIFERDHGGANTWGQVAEFKLAAASLGGCVGEAVKGDTAIIGCSRTDTQLGQALVYQRNLGGAEAWGLLATLSPLDGAANDLFGQALAIDGTTLVAGAPQLASATGAVYLFDSGLYLTPNPLDFGSQALGVTSSPRAVTIGNPTSASVVVSSATITGGNAGDFAIGSNTCTTLAPGASCQLTLTFTPSTAALASAVLSVQTDFAGTLTGALSGTGLAAAAPAIVTNPGNLTLSAGAAATFAASATGSPSPTVQWQQSSDNGVTFTTVSGATSTTLTFTAAAAMNGYRYRAVFSNSAGTATTTAAQLNVNAPVVVTTNPADVSLTIPVGQTATATFSAAATGSPSPTVQWQASTDFGATFSNIPGATSTTLSLSLSLSDNGNQYRAVFTNILGSVATTAAHFGALAPPVGASGGGGSLTLIDVLAALCLLALRRLQALRTSTTCRREPR